MYLSRAKAICTLSFTYLFNVYFMIPSIDICFKTCLASEADKYQNKLKERQERNASAIGKSSSDCITFFYSIHNNILVGYINIPYQYITFLIALITLFSYFFKHRECYSHFIHYIVLKPENELAVWDHARSYEK